MKTNLRILTLAAALCAGLALPAAAAEKDHKHQGTPKGGRLLDKTEPHAEFVVEKDRSVTINFYNHDMKPVPVAGQNVTVIADAKPQNLRFKLDMHTCGECKRAEYACVCGH